MTNLLCLDIEVLPNYFLVALKRLDDNQTFTFEAYDDKLPTEERHALHTLLRDHTSFGFNSLNYDIPIINAILSGRTTEKIYEMSADIVENGLPFYRTYNEYDVKNRPYKHFDIKEPSPAVMISLKNYGTRVGSKKLQEFYLDPHTAITLQQVEPLKAYCWNDINVTIDLFNAI